MEAVTLEAVLVIVLLAVVPESQAAGDCEGKESIRIGSKRYCSQVIISDDAYQTIVIDKYDNVYYINNEYDIKILAPNQNNSTILIGSPDKVVSDLMADGEDILISTHWNGFHKYSTVTKSMRQFISLDEESRFSRLGAKTKNEIYAIDFKNKTLHRISENTVGPSEDLEKALVFTFDTKTGDFYYCPFVQGYLAVVRANQPWNMKTYIQGLPTEIVKTHELTYDRINNVVYICRKDGMYYLQPPSLVAHRVEGVSVVTALGLDGRGGMYLGLEGQILKLLPVTRNFAAPTNKVPHCFESDEEYCNKQLLETFFAKVNTFFNNH